MDAPPQFPDAITGAPRVILRSAAITRGVNSDDIARKRRTQEWIGLRPGAYVRAAELKGIDEVQRHLLLIDATLPSLSAGAVISHNSASCVHGIAAWQANLSTVQVTRQGSGGAHRRRLLHTIRADLESDEVMSWRGFRVTSPQRTLIDVLRSSSFDAAVVAADCTRRLGVVTHEDLLAGANRAPQRPGMRQARQVIDLADPRSKSIGESLSRVALFNAGLPKPTLQLVVRSAAGFVLGRCDFGWPDYPDCGCSSTGP